MACPVLDKWFEVSFNVLFLPYLRTSNLTSFIIVVIINSAIAISYWFIFHHSIYGYKRRARVNCGTMDRRTTGLYGRQAGKSYSCDRKKGENFFSITKNVTGYFVYIKQFQIHKQCSLQTYK